MIAGTAPAGMAAVAATVIAAVETVAATLAATAAEMVTVAGPGCSRASAATRTS
jgi:hypothetical protein